MEEQKPQTKEEIIKQMKFHQDQYALLKSQMNEIQRNENRELHKKRQLARLEEFKIKYKFYVTSGDPILIDWEEVEKLLNVSFTQDVGYALGWDDSGMPGLGSANGFSPMVEEEQDARKYIEREAKRKEIASRRKSEQEHV